MPNSHALDALLHATAPIPLSEVRKFIDESNNRLIAEFLSNLRDNDLDRTRLYKKWEGRKK